LENYVTQMTLWGRLQVTTLYLGMYSKCREQMG